MAEMVCSALVQEAVSRGISFVLGKREEKASQVHLMERLEMAVSQMEFALERSQELRIRHLSLISCRKKIKCAYVPAMELLEKHKQQQAVPVPPGQELQVARGVKRKRRWLFWAEDMPITPSAALNMDDVRRFKWYADCAHRFVRDVESGYSLHHYTFCNPIVRHLLERNSLRYCFKKGNQLRSFCIWPMYSDERGVEAVLEYRYQDSAVAEKCFIVLLILRLSESTDIVGVSTKCLQSLTSEFKLAAESAMGELTLLSNSQDIAHWYGPPSVGIQDWHIKLTQLVRPDPACCEGSRHRLGANSNVSSELLSDMFPEQVIYGGFECYYVPALEPSRSSCSSFDVVGRSKSRGGGKPPLLLTATLKFSPHYATNMELRFALASVGDVNVYSVACSIQQVAETLESNTINCFFRQPELTKYEIFWYSRHGIPYSLNFVPKQTLTLTTSKDVSSYCTRVK